MTELLTESFCERCGTRYTFESSAPRRSRVGRVRTFSKGVRNFVLSDESSFSEAMADARSEDELSATAHQLDAFHKTFNFCLTCRQYTCGTCWNPSEGRCLTCAPSPEADAAAARADLMRLEASGTAPVEETALVPFGAEGTVSLEETGHSHTDVDEAWPEADLERINAVLGYPAPPESLDDYGVGARPPQAEDATADIVAAGALDAEETTGREVTGETWGGEPPSIAPEPDASAVTEAPDEPDALAAVTEAADEADVAAELDEAAAVAEVSGEPGVAAELEASRETGRAAGAAGAAGAELIGATPGQSLEDAIAAYESRLEAQEIAEAASAARAMAEQEPKAAEAIPAAEAPAPQEEVPIAGIAPPTAAEQVADEPAFIETPAPEPIVASSQAAEPPVEVAAAAEPQIDEPAAAAEQPADVPPPPEQAAMPEPEPAEAVAPPPPPTPTDIIAQPTWPPAPPQPASDGAPAPAAEPPSPPAATPDQAPDAPAPWLRVAPDNDAGPAPQWPSTPPLRSSSGREMPTTLAGRPLLPRDDASALWAASAREVLGSAPVGTPSQATVPSPQPCVQCGLSLSASARFCRRCGSRQG
jgi:hypothetical protein